MRPMLSPATSLRRLLFATICMAGMLPCAGAQASDAAIARALAAERVDINLESVPLELAIYRIVGLFSQVVRVGWAEDLEPQGKKVTMQVTQRPIGEVLREVLQSQRLDYVIKGGNIEIIRARERRCVELAEVTERFERLGITVGMTLPKADRCDSRAMVHASPGDPGSMVAEGHDVGSGVKVALVQPQGVIFLFEGQAFEVRAPGNPAPVFTDTPSSTEPAGNTGMKPSEADERAFGELGLRVTIIVVNKDDPRNSVAMVGNQDVLIGDSLPGGVIVKDIRPTYVVFEFRGFDWNVYNGAGPR